MRWGKGLVCAALLWQLSGCSVLLSDMPKDDFEPELAPTCHVIGAGADVAGAIGFGILALVGLASGEGVLTVPGLLGGLGHSISAGVGSTGATKCKEQRQEHAEFIERQQAQIWSLEKKLRLAREGSSNSSDTDDERDDQLARPETGASQETPKDETTPIDESPADPWSDEEEVEERPRRDERPRDPKPVSADPYEAFWRATTP